MSYDLITRRTGGSNFARGVTTTDVTADHHEPVSRAKRDVFMGVVSGVLTHVLLGGILKS